MDIAFYAFLMFFTMLSCLGLRFRSGHAIQRTGMHMMIYMVLCFGVFYLYSIGIFTNEGNPCPYGSEYIIPLTVLILFFCLFLIFFLSDVFCYNRRGGAQDFSAALKLISRKISGFQNIILASLVLFCFLHFFTREESIFWHSNVYLLMMSPEGGIPGAFSKFIGSIITPVYFLSCIILGVVMSSGRLPATILAGTVVTWLCLLEVSAASRVAGIGIILFGVFRAATVGIFRTSVIISLSIGLYLIAAALAGRAIGMFGLDNVFVQLSSPLSGNIGFSDLITNLFQGALSTGDGMLVGGAFPEIYKLLSLSPFPSFIDGFDKIREASEIRLGVYCPMGAVAELTNFGPSYWIPYGIGYVAMVVLINSRFVASRVSPLLVVSANGLFSLFSIGGFTYPLRTVTRVLFYLFALVMLAALFSRNRNKLVSARGSQLVATRRRSPVSARHSSDI